MKENTKKFPKGILTVKIESCVIRSKNRLLEQDPYVMLKLKNITFQTDIKLKTTNPEWNQSFTFDLSEHSFQDELILQLLDHHKFVSDNLLGQVAITLEEFVVKRQIKSKPYSIFSSKASKTGEPIGELSISSLFQEDPSSKPTKQKKDLITAADLSFDGLVKLTILSGINLFANPSIKSGYLSLTTYKERRTTKHFRSTIAQIQASFLFPVSCNEKPWYFELHNKKTNSRESDKTVAFGELDITKLYLIVNKPFTYGLMLNGLDGAKLLIEIRFLSSGFIRNPMGTIRVEFTNLPSFKKEAKEPFYRMFYNGEYMKIRCDKPGSGHEIRIIKTKNVLEAFNLEYFESSSSMKEKLTHGLVPQKPKGSYRVNLCDLSWKEVKNGNFEAFVKGKMNIKSKSLDFCMLLTFTNQSQFTISQSLTNKTDSPELLQANTEENEENQEIIDPNSHRKPREKTFTIFKRSVESAAPVIVLELTSLHLRGFPLLSFEKQPLAGGIYVKIDYSENNEGFFTSVTQNLSRLYWENEIPLLISCPETAINFTLAGTVFGEFLEDRSFFPWEMLSFKLSLQDLEESVYFVPLKETLRAPLLGKDFEVFLQKTHERKEIEAFKDITLDISFKLHASSLISHPQGILRIEQLSLQEFELGSSRNNLTFLQDPCISLSLSAQTSQIADNILMNRQSQKPVFFITSSCSENLLIQIDEQRQTEENIAVLRLELPLYTLRLEEERPLKHFIDLEELTNSGLRGRLLINFLYTPYRRSPLQSLCRSLRNTQENTAVKPLNFCEKTLGFPCRLWVQVSSLKLCDAIKHDFLIMELSCSQETAAQVLNSQQGPELYETFCIDVENSLQSLFLRLVLYEYKGSAACIKEVLLAQIEFSRLLLRKPGWNRISAAFLSNSSPTRALKSSVSLRLRAESLRFSHCFLSFAPLQLRTLASTHPAKRLWSSTARYFLRISAESRGVDLLFPAKLSAVEPLKHTLLFEPTQLSAAALDLTCSACDIKINVPSFFEADAKLFLQAGDCVSFAVFRCENSELFAEEALEFSRLRTCEGVFLEFRGSLQISSLISLLTSEKTLKNAAFPVKLSREGLLNSKKSLIDEEDDEYSELLDLSLFEYCYLFLQLRDFLPFSLEPAAETKRKEQLSQETRNLLRVRLLSLRNLSQRVSATIGHSVFLKKKPQVAENVSLSLLQQANLEANSKKLTASRLALQRFRCDFFEELQLLSQENVPKVLDFWLLSCSLEHKFSTNLLEFEEPLAFCVRTGEILQKTRKVQLSVPVFKEDALEAVFTAEIVRETGDFVDNSEGTLTISAVEIQELENKPFLKEFADFSIHFQVISFRDLKFSIKEEGNSESFLDCAAFQQQFLEKSATNSLISLNPVFLSTNSPAECLYIRFLHKSSEKRAIRYFPIVLRLAKLRLFSNKNLQELVTVRVAAPCAVLQGSSQETVAVFCVNLAISYQNNADNKDSQALSLEKLVKLKQKFKHLQEKLYKFVYFDPLSCRELEFSAKFLATFQEYPADELKKEFKETQNFLESLKTATNSAEMPFLRVCAGTELFLRESLKKNCEISLSFALLAENRAVLLRNSQVLSQHSFELSEIRSFHEDRVLQTCLRFIKDFCYFFDENIAKIARFCEFSLQFCNKSLETCREVAEISLSSCSLLQKQLLFLFKPSQTRVFFRVQRAPISLKNAAISGKLRFSVHRLVLFAEKPAENAEKPQLFDYKNCELLGNSQIDAFLQLLVRVKDKISSFSLTKEGLCEEPLETREFFFDNPQDSVKISLFLSKKRNNLAQTPENELLLCEGEAFIPLFLRSSCKNFLAIPLKPANFCTNSIFSQFLSTLNRENLYLLASCEVFPKKWRVVKLFLRKLLFFCSDASFFAVKGEVLLMKGDSLLKISSFDSEFVEFDGISPQEIALSAGNFVEILFEEDAGDAYFANISIVSQENSETKPLCCRYLPLRPLLAENIADSQEFLLDFPEKPDFVQLLLEIRGKNCENRENREKTAKSQEMPQKLDFRRNKIEEMLISLLNTNSVEIVLLILKEIHEYLLFSAETVQVFELMLQMLLMMLQIYAENSEVIAVLLQTVYNLFTIDAKKACEIANSQGFLRLVAEILAAVPGFKENEDNSQGKSQETAIFSTKLQKKSNSFELVAIKPETFAKMKKEEINARLLDNFLARKSSFLVNFDKNRGFSQYKPKDLEKFLQYALRINEFFFEFEENRENCQLILSKVARFAQFLSKNLQLSALFLQNCDKFLRTGFEDAQTCDLLRQIFPLTAQILQKPELSASEEDEFLRKLDFFFAAGTAKSLWKQEEVLFFAKAMSSAIKANNLGNNCAYLLNELTLLLRLLRTYQENAAVSAEIFAGLKKMLAEGELLDVLFEFLQTDARKSSEKAGNKLVFLNDRLFSLLLDVVLVIFKHYELQKHEKMLAFCDFLRKNLKEAALLGEVKAKALEEFLQETAQKQVLAKKTAKKEHVAENSEKKLALSKKYLISRLDWL